MGYKVEHKVIARLKAHLRKVKRELLLEKQNPLSNLKGVPSPKNEKIAKENDKLIKLLKDNYPG